MPGPETLLVLALVGAAGGVVGGIGGPGGIPVILTLNAVVALSSPVAAATASLVFVVATLSATGLYRYSDGIAWGLAALVAVPAVLGTHLGTRLAPTLSVARFETVLAGTLLLAVVGIVYRQRRTDGPAASGSPVPTAPGDRAERWRTTGRVGLVGLGSLCVGVAAGITGIGGPALTVPLMLVAGIAPVTAIGAGLASGVLITVNATAGHAVQGTTPALVPALVVGVPYVLAQVLGWRYVHSVSERTVAYTVAAVAVVGVVVIVV
ncbi:sulfite exporter TauE/SafE family protein [Halomicroarcula sp. S3CR25-11]|uniref:Probable membrane transporter protein n=2 Tax=Haloarcula onubensis TaxID=2950539 RepID=A0ABU2FT10_9EURY|nr:sulfite exporter TauE/SafE family protein [Halomicroarcula sp. S3CR25-11]